MSDVQKLIKQITKEIILKNARNLQDRLYRDEPLIFTASQMKSYVPEEIKNMKKIASDPSAFYLTEACIFYRQAKFMESFEDDFEYDGDFFTYYPTYQRMNNSQLRGYFSWRTKVRKGEITKTSLSFVYVYIYELINGVGWDTPEEGFGKFRDFCEAYSNLEPAILRYVKTWLVDFAVYYNVDKSLLDVLVDTEFDKNAAMLRDYELHSEDELWEAISSLSSYNMENSKLYKLSPDDVKTVTCGVFRECSAYYLKNRSRSFCEKLFGRTVEMSYHMFESAVFYDRKKYTDYTYEITGSHKYSCKNGSWYCEKFYGNKKSKQLGDILKSIDSIMRQKLELGNPIACPCDTKWILKIISGEIDRLLENKRKNAVPKIEIDVSKLAGIRKSADITRDRLMTEEERGSSGERTIIPGEEEFPLDDSPEIPGAITFFGSEEKVSDGIGEIPEITGIPPTAEKIAPKNDTTLDDDEYEFLRCLLYGGSYGGKAMPSILADSINEKLYDEFDDVVIEFEGDKPVIIEDYADDLKGMIPE